jgi:hypothetical protein
MERRRAPSRRHQEIWLRCIVASGDVTKRGTNTARARDRRCTQLRFAYSLALGRPFHTPSLDHLIAAMRETRHEFGPTAVGHEGAELIGGPRLDDTTRRDMQLRRFRGQAKRAAHETRYYQRLFAELDLDPGSLGATDIARLPLTPKDALRGDSDAFVRRGARPVLRAMTTGTTGWPISVYFSEYELRVIVALSALGMLFDRQLG